MQVLAVQPEIVWEDRPANYATVRRLVAAAAPAPGALIVLPEMFATGFSMGAAAVEPEDGPTSAFLRALSGEYDVTVTAGIARCGADGLARNEAVTVGPEVESVYTKQRPFRPGGEIYHAGGAPSAFAHAGATVCPLICYDLRFPELFRAAARLWRPEVFLVIASWPSYRVHHWLRLLQARAVENQAFVVGVNRAGVDPEHAFPGRSVIVDPDGELLADAGAGEGTLAATLDLPGLHATRARLPFLDDLR